MESRVQKLSSIEIIGDDKMSLREVGLIFNSRRVGPTNFNGLRNADYGSGFRMQTLPELVEFGYNSLENGEYRPAQEFSKSLRKSWLTGNTGVLYVQGGMFVQDNPDMKSGRILMNEKTLKDKLGSYEEKGVVFSDDRSIRFTPYNYSTSPQSSSDLSRNTGIIALVGGEEKAEKIARVSQYYILDPIFWASSYAQLPDIRITSLSSRGSEPQFRLGANLSEFDEGRYSFGVSKEVDKN